MKKLTGILFLIFFVFSASVGAQQARFIPVTPDEKDSIPENVSEIPVPPLSENLDRTPVAVRDTNAIVTSKYGWTVDMRSGVRTLKNTDKTMFDFHQSTLMDSKDIAVSYLGNVGSPAQSMYFFERGENRLYPFLNVFDYYYKYPDDVIYINTKAPYSNVFYQSGGGRMEKEERLKTEFTLNSGKKFNFGFNLDYVYARGFYNNLSNKQFNYDLNASYISERYQMHAYFMHNYYNNSENGGITDTRFITDPDNPSLASDWSKGKSSRDIPVRINQLWNKLSGRQFFLSNKYDVGWERTSNEGGDTEFVPVASFILTTHYADQQRTFASRDETMVTTDWGYVLAADTVYFKNANDYYNENNGYPLMRSAPAKDLMGYWSLKNTFAITLNEGFKEWVKFGLTAFIEQDFRKYSIPMQFPGVIDKKSQNSTVIGGILSKEKGRNLHYNLKADLGVIGYNAGEFNLHADISTHIRFAGKEAVVRANGYIKNLKPSFYENNFRTKYINWDNDFSDVKRIFAGGEIIIPQTKTYISGGVENIDHYIYYGQDRRIAQTSKNIQIIGLKLKQNLKAGIFHWDNQIAYQVSSEKDIIPLPSLSLYSNIYISTRLVKVLSLQLGVDARFFTKYKAPGYDPALLQFHNQQEQEIGGFPFATGYLNLNLKNTRFFLMMYNIAESMGNSDYFTTPYYPVAPMTFKMGISWDFNN